MSYHYYRSCAVPHCRSSSVKTPHKLFVHVPRNEDRRRMWLKLAGRNSKFSHQTAVYFCEDHFDLPNDMINYTEYKVMGSVKKILVSDLCLPTKFNCQRERIEKTCSSSPHSSEAKDESYRQCEKIPDESQIREKQEQTDIDSEGKPSNDPDHPDYVPSIFPFKPLAKFKDEEKSSRFQKLDKLAGSSTSKQAEPFAASILIKSKYDPDRGQTPPVRRKRLIDDEPSSSQETQRQNAAANGAPQLPETSEGANSNPKKEELPATSSQSDPNTSVAETSAPTDAEEPPAKVAKIPKPRVAKVPQPSLVVDGPRKRKPTQPFTPDVESVVKRSTARSEKGEYVFAGKRLVNMGYFLKSLQQLNDHNDRKCNFSDMRVCDETKDGWNVGIVFTCNLCTTTKIIWMEDPNTKEAPPSRIIFKPNAATKLNSTGLQPIHSPWLLRAPTTTGPKTQKPTVQAKLSITPPASHGQKRVSRPYWSKRKTPTPPPDDDTPPGHILQQTSPQVTMQMRGISNYPSTLLIRPNTTLRYGPLQAPFTGQLQLQPVIRQIPAISQSQVDSQSQGPVIVQSQIRVVNQSQAPATGPSQGPVIAQTKLFKQLQGSDVDQSQTHTVSQSLDFPQVASIKQELILPDNGTKQSYINSSSEPPRIEMTFCVDQDENTAELGNVPTDTHTAMNVTEDIAATPDAFAHTSISLQGPSGQLSSSIAMDVTATPGIAPMDTLPVDLNLVKKEVDDETM